MSKHKVFGRRWFTIKGEDFKVELRENGVYVRKRNSRTNWWLPPSYLLHLCKNQIELPFENVAVPTLPYNENPVDKSNESQPVPGVQEGQLVRPERERGLVHEGPERPPPSSQVGGDGLDSPSRCDHKFIDSNTCLKCGWEAPPKGELPIINEPVAHKDQPGTAGSLGGLAGRAAVDPQ